MTTRSRLLLTGATVGLLIGSTALAPPALAQSVANWAVDTTANTASNAGIFDNLAAAKWGDGYNDPFVAPFAPGIPTKAPPKQPDPPWWFHGFVEVGGRGFTNAPQDGGAMWQGGGRSSLAKFNEYSDIKPGPFGNFWLATGSRDGLYELDVWGKNAGYDDQRYIVDMSKAGEHYLTFGWDQTPHVYSDGASTLYNGVGSTHLTLPPGLSALLFGAAGCTLVGGLPAGCNAGPPANTITPANAAVVRTDILNNLQQGSLGIRRDTAALDYRYTPTDAWDIRVNYTNMRRTGTQVDGVTFSSSTSGVAVQAPRPVADTTQNYGASAEYLGTSPWDKKYTIKVAYSGSTYTDDFDRYFVDNPFCAAGAIGDQCARSNSTAPNNALSSPVAMMSTAPSNQANGGTATFAADLPLSSRYMATAAYTLMEQQQQFLPFTNTAAFANNAGANVPLHWGGIPGVAANSLAALPAQNLSGGIQTILVNNAVTTQITSDLKSKFSYRYYNYDNREPEIFFPDWVQSDAVAGSAQSLHAPVNTLTISYVKQDGGADLNWRPTRQWNLGAAYGFERYDWTRADASATNENSAKFYADYKPTGWLTARGSITYGLRRSDNYNYLANVGLFQWPGTPLGTAAGIYASSVRQLYLDDRDRTVGKLQVDIALAPTVTLSPMLIYRNDWYHIDPTQRQGLQWNNSVSAGVELAYAVSPDTSILLSYMNDRQKQRLSLDSAAADANGNFAPANLFATTVDDRVNTYVVAVNHAVIPKKLDVRFAYTVADAVDHQPWNNVPQTSIAPGNQFPDVKTFWQRVDVTGIYTFDDELVQRLGWKGTVKAKLRYAWERNSVANWQNDMMSPYMYSSSLTGTGFQTWMAYDNPNYNAQMVYGSIVAGW